MAIQSVGGGEPTNIEGTQVATPGGSDTPAQGSATAATDESGEGKPFHIAKDGTEFKTFEDLAKAWDARNEPAGESTTPESAGNDTLKAAEGDDAIVARLKEAGGIYADERYQPFALEFEKTGDLAADSVKKAAEAFAVPESFIQEFINNAKAAREATSKAADQPTPEMVKLGAAILEVVPDEGQYKALLAWGKDNLSAPEIKAYDAALDRHDEVAAKALLQGFHAKFAASGDGPGPRDVTTEGVGASSSGGTTGYASSAEMQRDMGDPRYANDPAFRRSVEQKVAASKF